MRKLLRGALCCALLVLGSNASAETITFFNLTGHNAAHAAAGEQQLAVEVTALPGTGDNGGALVSFVFTNEGSHPSSITDLYFDDGTLFGVAWIGDSQGAQFSPGAHPWNLPGGITLLDDPFVRTQGFTFDSDRPLWLNGVQPGDYVEVVVELLPGYHFEDTLHALATGDLRIGIRTRYGVFAHESFVNRPVPEPGTVIGLATFGVVAAAFGAHRRRARD